jgi:hypothetical protein
MKRLLDPQAPTMTLYRVPDFYRDPDVGPAEIRQDVELAAVQTGEAFVTDQLANWWVSVGESLEDYLARRRKR